MRLFVPLKTSMGSEFRDSGLGIDAGMLDSGLDDHWPPTADLMPLISAGRSSTFFLEP